MKKHFENLKSFSMKCRRVWSVLRKPSRKEFELVTKVSAIGIVAIGFIGFVISIFMGLFL